MISLPAPLIVRSYLARSARLWLLARSLLVLQQLMANQDPRGFGLSLAAVIVTVMLGFVEITRRHEQALLGNLGVESRDLVWLFVMPPVIGETLLQIVFALAA